MSKVIFLALVLVYGAVAANLAYDSLDLGGETSTISLKAEAPTRPSVSLQWSGGGTRNQVTFIPATPFLVLLGIAGPMGLGSITLSYLRTS